MARIKQDESLDDFDFDDFGDMGDFGGFDDAEPMVPKRTVFGRLFGGFKDGVKDSLFNPENQKKLVTSALPPGYSRIYDAAEFSLESVDSLYSEVGKGWKQNQTQIKQTLNQTLPQIAGVDKNPYGKRLKAWAADVRSPSVDAVDQDEALLTTSMSDVFGTPGETSLSERKASLKDKIQEDAALKLTDQASKASQIMSDRAGLEQGSNMLAHLAGSRIALEKLVSYQDQVTNQYQKKSLELKYRHYFVARKTLDVLTQGLDLSKSAFEKLVVNTSLPEAVKIHNSEMAHQILREKFLGEVIQPASARFATVGRKILNKGRKKIQDFFKDLGAQLSTVSDGASMFLGEDSGIDFTDTVGSIAGSAAGGRAMGWLGNKASGFFGKNEKMRRLGAAGSSFLGSSGRIFQSMLRNDTGFAPLEWLKSTGFLDEFIHRQDDTIRKDASSLLDQQALWDQKSRQALTVVIPGFLAKIENKLAMMHHYSVHGEDVDPGELVFDYASGYFENRKKLKAKHEEKLFGANANKDQAQIIRNALSTVEKTGTLTRGARDAFTDVMLDTAADGTDFDFEGYIRGTKSFSSDAEVNKELQVAFTKSFFPEYDPKRDGDPGKFMSRLNANYRRDGNTGARNTFREHLNQLGGRMGNFDNATLLQLTNTYGVDYVSTLGVTTRDGNATKADKSKLRTNVKDLIQNLNVDYLSGDVHDLEDDDSVLGGGYNSKVKQKIVAADNIFNRKITDGEKNVLQMIYNNLRAVLFRDNPEHLNLVDLDQPIKVEYLKLAEDVLKRWRDTADYDRLSDDAKTYFNSRYDIIKAGTSARKLPASLNDYLRVPLNFDDTAWAKSKKKLLDQLKAAGVDERIIAELNSKIKDVKDNTGKTVDMKIKEILGTGKVQDVVRFFDNASDKGLRWFYDSVRDPNSPPAALPPEETLFKKLSGVGKTAAKHSKVGRWLYKKILDADSMINNSMDNERRNQDLKQQVDKFGANANGSQFDYDRFDSTDTIGGKWRNLSFDENLKAFTYEDLEGKQYVRKVSHLAGKTADTSEQALKHYRDQIAAELRSGRKTRIAKYDAQKAEAALNLRRSAAQAADDERLAGQNRLSNLVNEALQRASSGIDVINNNLNSQDQASVVYEAKMIKYDAGTGIFSYTDRDNKLKQVRITALMSSENKGDMRLVNWYRDQIVVRLNAKKGTGGSYAKPTGTQLSSQSNDDPTIEKHHNGGIVGTADADIWTGAPKYHKGGVVKGKNKGGKVPFHVKHPRLAERAKHRSTLSEALAPNEVPAVLEEGEEVLTADDPRHTRNLNQGQPVSDNANPVVKVFHDNTKKGTFYYYTKSGMRIDIQVRKLAKAEGFPDQETIAAYCAKVAAQLTEWNKGLAFIGASEQEQRLTQLVNSSSQDAPVTVKEALREDTSPMLTTPASEVTAEAKDTKAQSQVLDDLKSRSADFASNSISRLTGGLIPAGTLKGIWSKLRADLKTGGDTNLNFTERLKDAFSNPELMGPSLERKSFMDMLREAKGVRQSALDARGSQAFVGPLPQEEEPASVVSAQQSIVASSNRIAELKETQADQLEVLLEVLQANLTMSEYLSIIASKEFGQAGGPGFFKRIGTKVGNGYRAAKGFAAKRISGLKSGVGKVFGGVKNLLTGLPSAAWNLAGNLYQRGKQSFANGLNRASRVGSVLKDGAIHAGQEAWRIGGALGRATKDSAVALGEGAMEFGRRLKDEIPKLKEIVKLGGLWMGEQFVSAKELIAAKYQASTEWFKTHYPKWTPDFSTFWTKFKEKFKSYNPVTWAKGKYQGAKGWIKDQGDTAKALAFNAGAMLKHTASNIATAPWKAAKWAGKKLMSGVNVVKGLFSGGGFWAAMKYKDVQNITDEVSGLRQVYLGIVDLQTIMMDRLPKSKKLSVFDKDGDGKRDRVRGWIGRDGAAAVEADGKVQTKDEKESPSLLKSIFGASMMGLAIKALIGGMVGEFMSNTFGFDLGLVGNSLAGMAAVGGAIWGTKKLAGLATQGAGNLAKKGAGKVWDKVRGRKSGTTGTGESVADALTGNASGGCGCCCCGDDDNQGGMDGNDRDRNKRRNKRGRRGRGNQTARAGRGGRAARGASRTAAGTAEAGAGSRAAGGAARGGLVRGAGAVAGRAAVPLALAAGAYGLYETYNDDSMSKEEKIEAGGGIAGGMGGAMAGAAAGAAIGSVIPGVGTAIGGLLGGAIGYYGGEKLGGKIANAYNNTSLSDMGHGLAKAALWASPITLAGSLSWDMLKGAGSIFSSKKGKDTPITRFRFFQYGFDLDNDEKQSTAIFALEKDLLDGLTIVGHQPKLKAKRPLEEYYEMFGVDVKNPDQVKRWQLWFHYRFRPVFSSHVVEWNKELGNTKIHGDETQLGREQAAVYLANVHYKNPKTAPYNQLANPFGNQSGKLMDTNVVSKQYTVALEAVKAFPEKAKQAAAKVNNSVSAKAALVGDPAKDQAAVDAKLKAAQLQQRQNQQDQPTGFWSGLNAKLTKAAAPVVDKLNSASSAVVDTVSNVVAKMTGSQKEWQLKVYKAFKNAGFSEQQARVLTAEIGRENSYNPKYMFGGHADPHKGANLGMLSWQGDRRPRLVGFLKQAGVLTKGGDIIPSQEALDAQAKFIMWELKNTHAKVGKEFFADPNMPYTKAAFIIGKRYILWRITDPAYSAAGIKNRDSFYNMLLKQLGVRDGQLDASGGTNPTGQNALTTGAGVSSLWTGKVNGVNEPGSGVLTKAVQDKNASNHNVYDPKLGPITFGMPSDIAYAKDVQGFTIGKGNASLKELVLKSAETTSGGACHQGIINICRDIQKNFKIIRFTALNDGYHKGTSSKHAVGLALDFTVPNASLAAGYTRTLRSVLSANGIKGLVIDEYAKPSARATGGHIHLNFNSNQDAARYVALGGGKSINPVITKGTPANPKLAKISDKDDPISNGIANVNDSSAASKVIANTMTPVKAVGGSSLVKSTISRSLVVGAYYPNGAAKAAPVKNVVPAQKSVAGSTNLVRASAKNPSAAQNVAAATKPDIQAAKEAEQKMVAQSANQAAASDLTQANQQAKSERQAKIVNDTNSTLANIMQEQLSVQKQMNQTLTAIHKSISQLTDLRGGSGSMGVKPNAAPKGSRKPDEPAVSMRVI